MKSAPSGEPCGSGCPVRHGVRRARRLCLLRRLAQKRGGAGRRLPPDPRRCLQRDRARHEGARFPEGAARIQDADLGLHGRARRRRAGRRRKGRHGPARAGARRRRADATACPGRCWRRSGASNPISARDMGARPLVQSLSTLACYGQRAGYFRSELMAALKIIDRGYIPADKLAGSWAGAFGQTQFMPSSYLRLSAPGADGEPRHRRFRRRGARLDRALFREVGLAFRRALGLRGEAPARLFRPLRPPGQGPDVRLGRARDHADRRAPARRGRGGPASARRPGRAGLSGDEEFRRRLFLQRRRVLFARRLRACRPARGRTRRPDPWPTDDPGLSRAGRRELQTRLAQRGYDVGKPDGAIGAKTKAAIADFQQRAGLPVDGRASTKVLEALQR